MKPKQAELTKVEILILSTLGEIGNKLEDIVKGSRRKFETNSSNYLTEDIKLLWRAPEIYNFFYVKFGYESREELKAYVDQYIERLEINEAWESLEDIEAYWNEFVLSVSKRLNLNENHEDNFIKYYFINTKQLYNINQNAIVSSGIFEKLSLVIMFPIYLPGTLLNNFLISLDRLKKEMFIFGIDISVILFGSNKKAKLWLKQYKVSYESLYVDSSDEILKARRNLNTIFSIQSMEAIGLSSKVKKSFIIDNDVDWQKYLFPGGLALVNSDGTVYFEHLCSFVGDFPLGEELIEKVLTAFGSLNDLSKEQSVKYLKDGMKYYIPPKFERFQFEKHSGFYYDPETTLYYEPKSGYFYDGERGIYLHWCKESLCYLSVADSCSNALAVQQLAMAQPQLAIEDQSNNAELEKDRDAKKEVIIPKLADNAEIEVKDAVKEEIIPELIENVKFENIVIESNEKPEKEDFEPPAKKIKNN